MNATYQSAWGLTIQSAGTLFAIKTTEFRYTSLVQEIIFGVDSFDGVKESVDRFHWQRLMLCTSPSAQRNGLVTRIRADLGARLVAVYDHVRSHVPDDQVAEALALASENKIDAIIGLGGGSSIGMAKAISFDFEKKRDGSPTDQPRIPILAIPTTYAGSEMTPVYGITQHENSFARKVTVNDPRITPMLTIYDPRLTLDLPPDITAATGINALAHCIEAVYSITRNPLATAAALSGASCIAKQLPRCYAHGGDLEARTEMLIGSYLAGTALAHVAMGLHHGICHILGGSAGVPHGVANSIMLPHVMRFNADKLAHELAQIGDAMGLTHNGRTDFALAQAAAQCVYDMVGEMALPQHLREVGIKEADLPRLAQMAMASRTIQNNPKPITDSEQIETLLRAAW